MQQFHPAAPGANAGLPVHPHTGLTALGIVGGRPVWPVMGGSQPTGGEPAPGAPAPTPTPQPPTPPTPTPTPGPDPNTPVDVASLPANVQNLIRTLREENGTRRTAAQTAEQAKTAAEQRLAAMLKAAGFQPDGTAATDPEAAAARLTEERDQAKADAWESAVKLHIYGMAGRLNANAEALIDSVAFLDSLDDLVDKAPNSTEFKTSLEAKVQEAVTQNPARYKAGNAAPTPARSGGEFTGGPPGAQPITEEQLAQMSPAEIAKAYNEGRLKHLM
jgi:hypothetical protein